MKNFINHILSNSDSNENALKIGDKSYSYKKIISDSKAVALYYQNLRIQRVGIDTRKEYSTYVYILGAIFAKVSYVPIGHSLPQSRKTEICKRAEITLTPLSNDLTSILNDFDSANYTYSEHESMDEVYLLFTSGSTGSPKGVPIHFKQLESYIHNINKEINFSGLKNYSHMFELTFDLSVHDLFVTWTNGATLCVPSNEDLYFPNHYIEKYQIDCWFSVPTLAANMINMGLANQKSLSSIKLSLFCGEALPYSVAHTWYDLTKNKTINLYGPTEATIAFTIKEFNPEEKEKIVTLGRPFQDLNLKIAEDGELILIGDQVTDGYLDSPEKSKQSFYLEDNQNAYKTGDLVEKKDGRLCFLGRKDFQVQISGHRVELQEIEFHLIEMTQNNQLICITEPIGEVNANSISIISTKKIENLNELQKQLIEILPQYMIPSKAYLIDQLPTNSSGKTDRKAAAQKVIKV